MARKQKYQPTREDIDRATATFLKTNEIKKVTAENTPLNEKACCSYADAWLMSYNPSLFSQRV